MPCPSSTRPHRQSLVVVILTVLFLLLLGSALSTAAAPLSPDLAFDAFVTAAECVNGGTAEGDNCTCPLYYTSSTCAERQCPNSVGGTGPNRILPVNPTNKFCDHCDAKQFNGLSCQLCQSNEACMGYAGRSAHCDKSMAIRGDNKQFQCTLNSPYFIHLMGDGRNISAEIMLNCSTSDGAAFSKSDTAKCEMAIYRIEPQQSYLDPFFRCQATSCSMSYGTTDVPDDEDSNGNSTWIQFTRKARSAGQVILVAECILLASLGAFTKALGPHRVKQITISLAAILTISVLVYIGLMMASMQPASGNPTFIYDCRKTHCACAEDPPAAYQPLCSESEVLTKHILPSIQNSIRFTCKAGTGDCELTLADLALVFQADCKASECVDVNRFPDSSSTDDKGGETVLARQNLGILLCLLLLLVASCVAVHYSYTRSISRQRGKEFLVTFHVNTPFVDVPTDEEEEEEPGDGSPPARSRGHTYHSDTEERAREDADAENASGAAGSSPLPREERQPLLALRASRSSRRAESVVSVRASVYEQASALTPAECAYIEHLRRLTAAPIELRVTDLHYALRSPWLGAADDRRNRAVLHRINFTAHSGDVLAIMGPSGAGKTTLLDLLSARAKSGIVEGTICLNATPIPTAGETAIQYRNMIGYVSQEDTLLPGLTVRQTIHYAARLKLPKALSARTVNRIVTRTIETLKLQHCEHTMIGGDTTRGISGGEKRRVSIAVELLANPRILYLDEPTSGLDTISAMRVIEAVVGLAKDSPMRLYAPHYFAFHPIVIFSIHQPSQEIYEMFDKVLILSRGMSVYCGPAVEATATLEQRITAAFGQTREVPRKEDHSNQAEYLMKLEEIIDDGVRAELQEEDIVRNFHSARHSTISTVVPPNRHSGAPVQQNVTVESVDDATVDGKELLVTAFGFRMYYANTYEQLQLLISRSVTCLVSSFHLVMCHSAVVACLATLMCVLYHEQALDLPGSMNRAGCVSFLLLVTSFVSLSCLEQLIVERKLFIVERENGFYTTWPYLVSKIVVDIIPLRVIPAMVLSSVIYFPMGFRVDAGIHFFWFILVVVLFSICITTMILCIGIVSGSFGAAALLSSVFILWNFVFGGALVQSETIPTSLRVFKQASPFFIAYESLMVNELNGQRCVFSPTDETGKPSSASIPIMCVQYLANGGLKPERFNADVLQLAIYCIFFVAFAGVLLATFTKLVR